MENKKANFKRIAENRTNKIITMISSLSNFSNTSFYEYTNEQIEEMFGAIQSELDKQKNELLSNNEGKKRKFEL